MGTLVQRWGGGLAALGAGAILLAFWALLPATYRVNESDDYLEFYAPVAHNLRHGQGLTLAGEPAVLYPPGYPVLLAGVFALAQGVGFSAAQGALGLTLVAQMLNTGLLYHLAAPVWGPGRAWWPAALWATYPFGLWLAKQPNSEGPFLALFLGALVMLRPLLWGGSVAHGGAVGRAIGGGVLLGLAALVRPIAVGVGGVLAAVLWVRRAQPALPGRVGWAALLLVGNALAVLPWEVWAYAQTGQVIPLSTNGPTSVRGGLIFALDTKGYREVLPVPPEVQTVMRYFLAWRDAGQLETWAQITPALVGQWQQHPTGMFQLYALKAARSWYATDSGRWENWAFLVQALYLLGLGLGAWRAWHLGGPARGVCLTVGALTLYFWGMTTLVLSILRYLMPAMALLFLLAPALGRTSSTQASYD